MNEPTLQLQQLSDWEELHEAHIDSRTEEGRQARKVAFYYFCIAAGCLCLAVVLFYMMWRVWFRG